MNRLLEIDSQIARARRRATCPPKPAAMALALSARPPALVRTRALAFDHGEPIRWHRAFGTTTLPQPPKPDALVGYARVGAVSPYLAVRKAPDASAAEVEQLRFNDRVLVLAKLSSPKDWAMVVTDNKNIGYVNALFLFYNPPEPNAILYKLEKGDSAIGVAEKFYKQGVGWGHDLRFYVNTLVYANRGEGDQRKGIHKDNKDDSWNATETKAGFYIWVPSLPFADSLRGVVSSGSITYELWQQVVGAWEWVKFGLAFVGGILHGAFASLWDTVTGIVDLIEMVWDLLKSIVTGTIVSDAKELWHALEKLSWDKVEKFLKDWFSDVKAKWTDSNPWKRGHYQGYVIGYIAMEVVMAIFTFGEATAAKWGGKIAKAIEFLKELKPVAKAIEKAEEVYKVGKGKWDDVRKLLKARRARKAVTKVLDATRAEALIAALGEKLAKELVGAFDSKALQALAKKPGRAVLEEVGSGTVKRLLAKGMTHDEFAEWSGELSAKLLKKYADKFDWDVLEHYGKKFWKKWKGITKDTMDHVLHPRLKRQGRFRTVSGGHEPKELKALVDANGTWIRLDAHPSVPDAGIAHFDINGGRGRLGRKTVMKDLDTNPKKWTAPCEEAIDNALRAKTIPNQLPSNYAGTMLHWTGTDSKGRTWAGWLKAPGSHAEPIEELVTFYPD